MTERRFLDREIAVTTRGEIREPASFVLDGVEHQVAEVVASWPDYGFGSSAGRRTRWWQRRHRSYFLVRTADDHVFELYHDRGTNLKHPERRRWFLTRQLR